MLSPTEAPRVDRGAELKRLVRAAAALHDLYDDKALGRAVGTSRNTVAAWWAGARPSPESIEAISRATGISVRELTDFLYFDGPPPSIAEPGSAPASAVAEGIRRDRERQQGGDPQGPAQSPAQPPRDRRGALS